MSSHFPLKSSRQGFSLAEMLVVVAIIGVLSVMAFPAFRGAIETSRATQCASNLRQIGIAAFAWSAENDGTLLISDQDSTAVAFWPALLAPYLRVEFELNNPAKQPPVYHCPSSASKFAAGEKEDFFVSYRANLYGSSQSFDHFGKYKLIKMAAIDPATFPILVDGTPQTPANWRGWFGFSKSDKKLIGFFHNDRANRLFADGHVDSAPALGWTPMSQFNWNALGFSGSPPSY